MNYLAHAYLAKESAEILVGGLMGDFVKGPVPSNLPPAISHGLISHRKIDAFTDAHLAVRSSKGLVSARRRRFAGIMIDVFFDHFLALHWQQFCDEPLTGFTSRTYDTLYRYWHVLPERLRRVLPFMAGQDWLASYRHLGAIHAAIDGISLRRLRRENSLYRGAGELEQNYRKFEQGFFEFFPDLMAYNRSITFSGNIR